MESFYAGTATSVETSQDRRPEPGRYGVPVASDYQRGRAEAGALALTVPMGEELAVRARERAADTQGTSTKSGGKGTRRGRSSALWLGLSCSGPLGKALLAVLGRRTAACARGGDDDHGHGNKL